jgi:hypothetical protein
MAEAQMRDGGKKSPIVVLRTKLDLADDPSLVAGIVDLRDGVAAT